MILDLHRLDSHSLVLLLDSVNEALSDLVRDIRYMRATLIVEIELAKGSTDYPKP